MILVFDTFLSNSSLYPNFQLEKELNEIRDSAYSYRYQTKDKIFLYTLLSLKNYPWKKIFINFDCDNNFCVNAITNKIQSELPNALIRNSRSSTGDDFVNFFENISKENDWIFFSPNNDHPFIAPKISDLNYLIEAAELAEKKYKVDVSIYYSHFTESINMIHKNNYLYFYTGRKFEVLDENDYCYTVITNPQPLESMQIMRKSQLINLFNLAKDSKAIRLESLTSFVNNTQKKHALIIPKFECCRHYDGYLHTKNVINHYLSANLVPPLFIPDGFFESQIKLRFGYLGTNTESISLNESATNYSFADPINGVDLKIKLEDLPDAWKNRIVNLDINPNYIPSDKQILINKLEILNPWYLVKFSVPAVIVFRFIWFLIFACLRSIKRIFIKTKAAH